MEAIFGDLAGVVNVLIKFDPVAGPAGELISVYLYHLPDPNIK